MSVGRALVALTCVASQLGAQRLHPAAAASVVTARVRSTTGTYSGTAFLGEGSLALGRFSLDVSYLQGTLNPAPNPSSATPGTSRDLIEGAALVGLRPTAWLTLATGPHARAYALGSGTQRWLFWELRARAATAFVGSAVRGYVELWRALSADANVPEPFDHAQGGEAGMILRLAHAPLAARVGYRIDHAVLGGGSRLETVDGMVIGAGLSF
ncbi:MAG TPA: hypothetical protein VJN39_02495 [Gemmatimonadales bacterium]|nr:hypothetical protein [Gemmatimonadales bacterium]